LIVFTNYNSEFKIKMFTFFSFLWNSPSCYTSHALNLWGMCFVVTGSVPDFLFSLLVYCIQPQKGNNVFVFSSWCEGFVTLRFIFIFSSWCEGFVTLRFIFELPRCLVWFWIIQFNVFLNHTRDCNDLSFWPMKV